MYSRNDGEHVKKLSGANDAVRNIRNHDEFAFFTPKKVKNDWTILTF